MKIVIAPDSFKDSLTAMEVARLIRAGLRHSFPKASYELIPLADGGEGTVAALVAARGGRLVRARVMGPLGNTVQAQYGRLPNGDAVVEMAAAAGLELVPHALRNPLRTTSYGAGQLVRRALDAGARRVLLGIGGSATVDGGLGFAQALGARFLDARGRGLAAPLTGADLSRVATVDLEQLDPRVGPALRVACDVDSPLVGPRGAARVFGPQKGATPAQVGRLEVGLQAFGRLLERHSGRRLLRAAGTGAAGGLGALLLGLFNGRLERGVDLVLEFAEVAARLQGASLVVTGEGRLDEQTGLGKAPQGIFLLARQLEIPIVAIGGSILLDVKGRKSGIADYAVSAVATPQTLDEALSQASGNVLAAARRLGNLLGVGQALKSKT